MKRYGPYTAQSGHLFYVDVVTDGTKTTVLVHREVMEFHLGRKLLTDEVVHHVNEDPSDNRIENLQVMSRSEHTMHHHPEKWIKLVCCECGIEFQRKLIQENGNRKLRKRSGPFCGKSCAGSWSAKQWGRGRFSSEKNVSPVCGTLKSYNKGCRCDLCRTANTDDCRNRRLKRRLANS